MELTRITKEHVSDSSLVELPKIIPVIWLRSIWISKFPIATFFFFLEKFFWGVYVNEKFILDILNIISQ